MRCVPYVSKLSLMSLFVLATLLSTGCPPPIRPGDPDTCPEGTARVCLGACAPLVAEGGACTLDPCEAGARICGPTHACVPDAATPGQGICRPAPTDGCDPDVAPGTEGNLCPQQTRCVRAGTREQFAAGEVCISFNRSTETIRGVCLPGAPDGSICDSSWEQSMVPGTRACKTCAQGLTCLDGACRRPCPNGRDDCPRDVANQGPNNVTYTCEPEPPTAESLCTTCSPLQALCNRSRQDAPGQPCCAPGAACQAVDGNAMACCLPAGQAGCSAGNDCCGNANCDDGRCEACGARDQMCCSGRADDCFDAAQECLGGQCRDCGRDGQPCCPVNAGGGACREGGTQCFPQDDLCHRCGADGQRTCPGPTCTQTGTAPFPDGTCRLCGANSQQACPNGVCTQPGTRMFPDGTCRLCGADNQPVCPGNACTQSGTQPFPDGLCHACGTPSTRCCPAGAPCGANAVCTGGTCSACGGPGAACCPGNVCTFPLTCTAGTCHALVQCGTTTCGPGEECLRGCSGLDSATCVAAGSHCCRPASAGLSSVICRREEACQNDGTSANCVRR